MDWNTPQAWRAHQIGTRLWQRHPDNHLVVSYRAERGEAVDDFCTDLTPILHGYAVANSRRSMQASFPAGWWNYAALRDIEGSIYVLADFKYPDSERLFAALEELESIILEVDRLCGGCGQEIDEGSRVITARVYTSELQDPRTSQPTSRPEYFKGRVCSPACLATWAARWPALSTTPQPA